MEEIKRAGITGCSDGLPREAEVKLQQLKIILENMGIIPVFSKHLFRGEDGRSSSAKERAGVLMEYYRNPEIDVIFDISGGDIANEILPYLDYQEIADARNHAGRLKQFWGYSDLTVVLNAVYAKTGNAGVLYQIRHLAADCNGLLRRDFAKAVFHTGEACMGKQMESRSPLFKFDYSFFQGTELSGIVVGGNIRCLLKLAGTQYFPDLTDKILFLEARSGLQPQMITYLSQLKQLGAFEKVSGILLGTFTQMEEHRKSMEYLVREAAGTQLPIVKTFEIGHGIDSKAIIIGNNIKLTSTGSGN